MIEIALYTSENIDRFVWPNSKTYEKHYLLPFIKEGVQKFITNVETEVALLHVGEQLFPMTINSFEYESSYVCSPYNACIIYAKEEIVKLQNKRLESALTLLANISGALLKTANINKIVCVNNWLLSTNIYPTWDGKEIPEITDFLTKKFPDHTVMFRSLNQHINGELLAAYASHGYNLIPSRQVYVFDKVKGDYTRKKNTKLDLKLLKKTSYMVVPHDAITHKDYPRITELYNKLYLDKYSYHNPQFTTNLIALWHQQKLLIMQGLRNDQGILDGIVGCFNRGGISTAPLVGYDTELPVSLGLYRMLIIMVIKFVSQEDMLLNLSSGASVFKCLRGAMPEIEYSAIYIKHLSCYRQFIWKLLTGILVYIGIPLMKKYKL